jgi:hypothetical protein
LRRVNGGGGRKPGSKPFPGGKKPFRSAKKPFAPAGARPQFGGGAQRHRDVVVEYRRGQAAK